jgi:hypothetical protein
LVLDPSSKAPNVAAIKQHWFEKHGGPWSFNEAVGLISIFVAPYKIGGLLYSPTGRVMKHMMRKRRVFVGKLFEFNVWPEEDAETIYENLRGWLSSTTSELQSLRGRVIDFETLDALGPHIDWIGITHTRVESASGLNQPASRP